MKKEDKTNKLEVEDFELLRAGINDSANLLADDELSELFGGYMCEPRCPMGYLNCTWAYCGKYDDGLPAE